MRTVLFIVLILNTSTVLFAQNQNYRIDSRPLNSVHLNVIGDASLLSINYERQFVVSPAFIISSKLGFGYNEEFQICISGSCSSDPDRYFTIPHHVTGNIGSGKRFFEFGIGGTLLIGNIAQPYLLYPIVGYRFLPLESSRINFRIYGQYPLGYDVDDILFFPVGLSLGISF